MKINRIIGILALGSIFLSCSKNKEDDPISDADAWKIVTETLNLPDSPYQYAVELPDYFNVPPLQATNNTPTTNPVTDWGATLGRVLFYEKGLSKNGTVNCGSCHQQALGFSDNKVLSDGFNGGKTDRHSMSLTQAAYYQSGQFFWDERANTLEDQVLMPIQNEVEMGLTLQEIETVLKSKPIYPILFKKAFGSETITTENVSLALAQFVRSMVSYKSKFDVGRAQVNGVGPQVLAQDFPNFTQQENMGKQLFFAAGPNAGNCAACHGTEHFTANVARSNGLDATTVDEGKGGNTGIQQDMALFKSPSLRNVALRAPYMHDGRFATLNEVIDFYASGVQDHPNLSPPLRLPDGTVQRINWSTGQKNAVVAFLNTLTDPSLTTDEKFSDPFK